MKKVSRYVAADGKEFAKQKDCLAYEKKIKTTILWINLLNEIHDDYEENGIEREDEFEFDFDNDNDDDEDYDRANKMRYASEIPISDLAEMLATDKRVKLV